jgi:hypothetical protein
MRLIQKGSRITLSMITMRMEKFAHTPQNQRIKVLTTAKGQLIPRAPKKVLIVIDIVIFYIV